MEKITKEMNIGELVEKYPQVREIFMQHGLGCIGCVASNFETLEEGLTAHDLDVDKIVDELNKKLEL